MIRKMMRNLLGESYTENNGKLAIVNFGIILIMFIVSGIMLLFLPDQISILHMGNTYYPLPSVLAVWLLPIIALLINIGFIKQKKSWQQEKSLYSINCLSNILFTYKRHCINTDTLTTNVMPISLCNSTHCNLRYLSATSNN